MSESRNIPPRVRRQLRQEACFGCAVCGDPILDYHHIIPWAEQKHNNPEHMVAVCPTHHRSIGKMKRGKQYDAKNNPINGTNGTVRGLLGTDQDAPSFILGSNTFVNTPVIFSYYHLPIIEYRLIDGQNCISAYLPKRDFWPELKISNNDFTAGVEGVWDIEFRTNYLKFVRSDRIQFFEIDLRGEHALVAANLDIGSKRFIFDADGTNFEGTSMRNSRFEDCGCGLYVGQKDTKLLVPNFAMATPRPIFHRSHRANVNPD